MVQSNKKDFSGQNISIGIDVHLRTWSVTVLTPSGFMRTHTQKASAKELFEHLNKHYPTSIILTVATMQPTRRGFRASRPIMP